MTVDTRSRSLVLVALLGAAVLTAPARAASPATQPARVLGAAGAKADKIVKLKHLSVNLTRKQVVMDSQVCLPRDAVMLELFVCGWGTKTHESILQTKATGAQLHTAMLLLGLLPGKPAKYVYDLDREIGWTIPPRGPGVTIEVRWKDKKGQSHQVPADEWLLKVGEKKTPIKIPTWVFVGSEVLPGGGYWADAEGEIISVSNFPSSVIDVPFESSNKNALRDIAVNRKAIPPIGTDVQVVITVDPKKAVSPHARVLLTIDAMGRLHVDGRPIAIEKLSQWAGKYIDAHAKGMVTIRAAARTRVYDVAKVLSELRLGGVYDTEIQRLGPVEPWLPRTRAQREAMLADFKARFARPQDYLQDPAEQAKETLQAVRNRIAELKAIEHLLDEYADDLGQGLKDYEAKRKQADKTADDSAASEN